MMYSANQERNHQGDEILLTLSQGGSSMTWSQVVDAWQSDPAFREFYSQTLADIDWGAFQWEHPPLSLGDMDAPYVSTLLHSEKLEQRHASATEYELFFVPGEQVVAFPDFHGDGLLVVPAAPAEGEGYGHLATFLRQAPATRIHAFWQTLGELLALSLSSEPQWLSTSESGVPWLHVVLSPNPRHCRTEAYHKA